MCIHNCSLPLREGCKDFCENRLHNGIVEKEKVDIYYKMNWIGYFTLSLLIYLCQVYLSGSETNKINNYESSNYSQYLIFGVCAKIEKRKILLFLGHFRWWDYVMKCMHLHISLSSLVVLVSLHIELSDTLV